MGVYHLYTEGTVSLVDIKIQPELVYPNIWIPSKCVRTVNPPPEAWGVHRGFIRRNPAGFRPCRENLAPHPHKQGIELLRDLALPTAAPSFSTNLYLQVEADLAPK